ncbi:MAG: DUF4157 domain-containing protein [Bacteroidetes bacterium]|nr:DUF4157 domain-containing protein [Bacteroidota bacterium]
MIPVYFKTNSWLAKLAAAILHKDNCAMVIRHTIHLHRITKAAILQDERLLCHELTHVMQWRQQGVVKFLLLYSWYSLRYGYYQNPFEKEARAKENDSSIRDHFIFK